MLHIWNIFFVFSKFSFSWTRFCRYFSIKCIENIRKTIEMLKSKEIQTFFFWKPVHNDFPGIKTHTKHYENLVLSIYLKKKRLHTSNTHLFFFFLAMWSCHDRFTSIFGVYDARNTHTSVVNIQQIYVLYYNIIPEIMFVLHNIIIIWQLWMYNSIWESIRNI